MQMLWLLQKLRAGFVLALRPSLFAFVLSASYAYLVATISVDHNLLSYKLFARECANQHEYLAYWNPKEAFPSFGIGHFIWLPDSSPASFEEQFPALLKFLENKKIELPDWIQGATHCLWKTKQEFDQDAKRLNELRVFLWSTRIEQSQFVSSQFEKHLELILTTYPNLKKRVHALSKSLLGYYAMMDYCHFKGTGLAFKESYKGRGWGLVQVLQGMPKRSKQPLKDFVISAQNVLTARAQSSDSKMEMRFLAGWIRRIQGYLDTSLTKD